MLRAVAAGIAATAMLAGTVHAAAAQPADVRAQGAASLAESRAAQPPNGWVRREVPNWIYWTPSRQWVATHTKNGIDVSSPTGDIVVNQGWSSWGYQLTTKEAIELIFSPSNTRDFSNLRITKRSKVTGRPGDQKQTVTWTGVRRHPLKGNQSVKGVTEVHVFVAGFGAYGFAVKGYMAPVAQWKSSLGTMRTILRHITYLPS